MKTTQQLQKTLRFRSLKIQKKREHTMDQIAGICLIALSVIAMFPIYWIIRSSLMTNPQLFRWPPHFVPPDWLFSNYPAASKQFPFWRYFINTMTIIVPDVTFGTVTATLCAFAFARLKFPGKKFIFGLCVGSMLLPGMVTLIPLYIMWARFFHLTNSYLPLILPFLCGGGAFNIFLIRQFIRTIPMELDEAAIIDGAGYFKILTRIIVPLIKPAMIVVALLIFILLWNDLLQQTLYIQSSDKWTIAIGLVNFKGALRQDWSMLMCATVMCFIPGIVFYLLGQRYFVEGIALTGMQSS